MTGYMKCSRDNKSYYVSTDYRSVTYSYGLCHTSVATAEVNFAGLFTTRWVVNRLNKRYKAYLAYSLASSHEQFTLK